MHPVSAHNYGSVYSNSISALDGRPSYQSRYSMPISVSGKSSILNDNDAMSPSAYGCNFSLTSFSVYPTTSPNRIDGSAPVLDPSMSISSTSGSPVNSSIDYKSAYQDVPAIFHRGGGKRGGIRLGSGNLQDLSVLLMCDSAVPKSPLGAHSSGHRSVRSAQHSVSPAPLRVHHLSLTSGARRVSPFDRTDSENELGSPPLATSAVAVNRAGRSMLHGGASRDVDHDDAHLPSSEANSLVSHNLTTRAAPQPANNPLSHSEDVGNLLRVLLAVSSKYDFSRLQIQMTCHCVDLNPNAQPDARLCYDFLNSGVCKREQTAGICRFRHLPVDHVETIVDRIRNGKVKEREKDEG